MLITFSFGFEQMDHCRLHFKSSLSMIRSHYLFNNHFHWFILYILYPKFSFMANILLIQVSSLYLFWSVVVYVWVCMFKIILSWRMFHKWRAQYMLSLSVYMMVHNIVQRLSKLEMIWAKWEEKCCIVDMSLIFQNTLHQICLMKYVL